MILLLDGVVELDDALFELRRDGAAIPLEPQAFDVLVHLVRNRDRVVAKEELMDAVWGGRFVSETAVTSRIKQVRRALGDDGQAQRAVRTVHGRGYRFVAAVDHAGDLPITAAQARAGHTDGPPTQPGAETTLRRPGACAVHHERRAAHRLPGDGRRRARRRADLRLRLAPRSGLERSAARLFPGSARFDGPADSIRQAGHRNVRPPTGCSRPRDPDARRSGGDGCGRV